MPTVLISDSYDVKLKSLVVEPFVETRESIIQELIDAEVARRSGMPNVKGAAGNNFRRLNPDFPDNLAFTRVLSATVDRLDMNRPRWNSVMDYLHIMALKRLGSFDKLSQASGARLRQGRYEEEGFKYVTEVDLSIQGVDSNLAWARSLRLARALEVPLRLVLEWRNTEKAAHPGETGVLEWAPAS